MASSAVRNAFRTAVQAASPPLPPYVDTIAQNVDRESLPDLWLALDFDQAPEFRASIGVPSLWRAKGATYVTVLGLTSNGDAAVTAGIDAVQTYFRNWQVPAIGLWVVNVDILSNVNQDSDGKWFYLSAAVWYERNFYQ